MTQQPQPRPDLPYPGHRPKRTHGGLVALGASLAAVVLLAGVVIGTQAISGGTAHSKGHHVVYTVGGTSRGAGLITYTIGGSTQQEAKMAIPWSKSYTLDGYAVYQVMAQNLNDDPGTVTCSIEVDGKVVQTASSVGPSTIAHCTSSSLG